MHVTVESPAAAAALGPLVPHRVVSRLVVSSVIALFADPPRPAPGPDAAAATFAAVGLKDPTAFSTRPTGDAITGPLRVTVRPPTAAEAARAPECPDHVAEWVATSAAEARRRGLAPTENADDVAAMPSFITRAGSGKVVGDALSEAMRARGVRRGAVGCLVLADINDADAVLCTATLVRRFRPAWVCFVGDTEALHPDSFSGCNTDVDVFDFSRLRKLQHLPIAQGGYGVHQKLRRIVLPRLAAAPLNKNSLFSMNDLKGLHVPWNWRPTSLGDSTACFANALVHLDLSFQVSITDLGDFTFQACEGLVSACFRGCISLCKLGWAAFADCRRLRIVDLAECPLVTADTIAVDTFGNCHALELIITSPHVDAAETSQRLETEWKLNGVKIVHSDENGGATTDDNAVTPNVHRVLDALEVLHDESHHTPKCALKPELNTVERLPLPGVVPALPPDFAASTSDDAVCDGQTSGDFKPAVRPERRTCPCCVSLVERYRRMQAAHPPPARRPAGPAVQVQHGVFGGANTCDDNNSASDPSAFGNTHLRWRK